ncbi:MAG TPA: hypothetical protein VGF76_00840 [Polyangiaceae bacterium]
MTVTQRVSTLVALLLFVACSSQSDRSPDALRAPVNHRESDARCPTARVAVHPTPFDCHDACTLFRCTQDSDCTLGKNGRCGSEPDGVGFVCSYDECSSDSDCANGARCECRPSADSATPNVCTPLSNCSFDAQCGSAGYCSPSQNLQWCGSFHACHTAEDTCIDDADCASSLSGGLPDTCNFDNAKQHWACSQGCGPMPK